MSELRRLVVIEAPRKADALEKTLLALGMPARVQATRGHLLASSQKLDAPAGVDRLFREFTRLPVNPEVVERLRKEAGEADVVIVATDADQEGDVIAWDVQETIADLHPRCLRASMRGMDADSVLEAMSNLRPVSRDDAIPGRARAVVDRLIGIAFSTREVKVGRVATALLGIVANQRPDIRRLNLSAPSRQGGRPFLASCPLGGAIDEKVAEALVSLTLPALAVARTEAAAWRPGHTGDVMVRAGDRMGLPPGEVMSSMQKMYEGGRLSYPRSSSRTMAPSVSVKFAAIMRKSGYHLVDGQYVKKDESDVHDAPHPIGPVDATKDPSMLGTDEGVRTMIAQDIVRAGLPRRAEKPDLKPLEDFLGQKGFRMEVVRTIVGLDWSREVGPSYPGEEAWGRSHVETRRADTVLVEKLCEVGLGRPSTWSTHIEKFMSRGLADQSLALTDKGRAWVAGSPPLLLDPRISAAIEKACANAPRNLLDEPDRDPWETFAEAIVTRLPPAISAPIVALVAHEPPRPRYDPAADFASREEARRPRAPDPSFSERMDGALVSRLELEMD